MDVHYSDELKQAFVVSPDHLKKLVELLQKRIGKVNISGDCVDKIERKFKTVKDLIAYENPKLKRIRRIYLTARSDDYSKSATIVFRDSFLFGSRISVDATGREDVVSRLKEEILDVIIGMRPWYNAIARTNLVLVFLILWFILGIIVGFIAMLRPDSSLDSAESVSYAETAVIMSLFFLCVWGLDGIRGFLLPLGVFAIGQGQSRFKLLEKIRWGVIISFGVSFAAGLLLLIFK